MACPHLQGEIRGCTLPKRAPGSVCQAQVPMQQRSSSQGAVLNKPMLSGASVLSHSSTRFCQKMSWPAADVCFLSPPPHPQPCTTSILASANSTTFMNLESDSPAASRPMGTTTNPTNTTNTVTTTANGGYAQDRLTSGHVPTSSSHQDTRCATSSCIALHHRTDMNH